MDIDGIVVPITIMSLVVVFLIITEIREILFYKKNNWNFDTDSNIGLKMYKGESNDEKDLVPNRVRVLYGMPLLIILSLILLIVFVSILLSKYFAFN